MEQPGQNKAAPLLLDQLNNGDMEGWGHPATGMSSHGSRRNGEQEMDPYPATAALPQGMTP